MNAPAPRPLPKWAVWVGSGVIGLHLMVFLMLALAAPSGPWPTPPPFPPDAGPAEPPPFAAAINNVTGRFILRHLYLSHPYRFASNETDAPSVDFEVRLKDKQGKEKTLRFPDKDANPWVRHRQHLMAQGLSGDMPVQRVQGQYVMPQGKTPETILVWENVKANDSTSVRLRKINELELAGDPATDPKHPLHQIGTRPSPWQLLLANAYVRYLCRVHQAESGELIRRYRYPIHPTVLFLPKNAPLLPGTFQDYYSSYGEVRLQEAKP